MRQKKRPERIPLAYRAEEAFKKAVAEAQEDHRRHGIPIAIWKDGKIVRVPAEEIVVREKSAEYTPHDKKRK